MSALDWFDNFDTIQVKPSRNFNHISTQTKLNVSETVFSPRTYLKKTNKQTTTTTITEQEDINQNILEFYLKL